MQLGFKFGPVLIDACDFCAQSGEFLSVYVALLAQQPNRDQLWAIESQPPQMNRSTLGQGTKPPIFCLPQMERPFVLLRMQ